MNKQLLEQSILGEHVFSLAEFHSLVLSLDAIELSDVPSVAKINEKIKIEMKNENEK